MGSIVRVVPLSPGELRAARAVIERAAAELGDAALASLAEIGLRRRRVWLVRDATGAWLFEVIEGSAELMSLGVEAVWATGGSALDAWIAERGGRSYVGDLSLVPLVPPTLDLELADEGPALAGGSARDRWRVELGRHAERRVS